MSALRDVIVNAICGVDGFYGDYDPIVDAMLSALKEGGFVVSLRGDHGWNDGTWFQVKQLPALGLALVRVEAGG